MKLTINENIRSYRKSFGLTQEQLAEAVGVTVGAVSKWESGLSNPDINMLPVLADFFEISVDVLLGYQLSCRTTELASEKIHKLRLSKRYDEGLAEVEKALKRFPNCFDIVYESAELYYVKGVEKGDNTALNKALELYNHACGLISQNTDPTVSELLLQSHIGTIYVSLGNMELALEHLKKYNARGVNNAVIGLILSQSEHYSEALPYLSESFLDCTMGLFRTVVGLANYYSCIGDDKSSIDVFMWMYSMIEGLKYPGRISYLDKIDVMLLAGCAKVAASMNNIGKAEEYLRQAAAAAQRFDAAPDFDTCNIKFYHGKTQTLSDDFGETAMSGIEKIMSEKDDVNSVLTELWRKIINEEK